MRKLVLLIAGVFTLVAWSACSKENGSEEAVGEPSIDFSYTPVDPVASTSIKFTAIVNPGSTDIKSWKWYFGNSTEATSAEKDPAFAYNQEGSFEVKLEGVDANGKKAIVKKTVIVQPDPVLEFPASLAWTLEDPTDIGTHNDATRPLIDDNGVVYYIVGGLSSSVSKLVAVNDGGNSASVKWTWAPGYGLRAAPSMGADGNIYQTGWTVTATVAKIDSGNGNVMWEKPTNNAGSSNSTAAIDKDGNIYVASRITASAGGIYSFDKNGNERWSVQAATGVGATYSSPAISKDGTTVYFYNTAKGQLTAYKTIDGSEKWAEPVKSQKSGLGTSIFIGADGTIYATNDEEVIAVADNGSTGSLKWATGGLLSPNSSGVVIGVNGDLYVGTKSGLKALNPATGIEKWTYPSWVEECVPAVDKNGNVYFGNNEGKFLIVNPAGELEKEITVGGPTALVHSPVISDNGNVYVEVADNQKIKLCKIVVEGGGPANSAWPMKGQNRKHTGLAK